MFFCIFDVDYLLYNFSSIKIQLEDERNNVLATEDRHKELTMSWLKERDEMKKELNEVKKLRDQSEKELKSLQKNHSSLVR